MPVDILDALKHGHAEPIADSHYAEAHGVISKLREAGRAILAEPYGCVFCDSGKLRNPAKSHAPECGFEMMRHALGEGADNG